MVVRLRFARYGSKHWPFYKLFVADARRARNGRHIDELGWYDPLAHKDGNKHVAFNFDRIKYWLSVGAQPTESVARILSRVGFFPARPTIGTTSNSGSEKTSSSNTTENSQSRV